MTLIMQNDGPEIKVFQSYHFYTAIKTISEEKKKKKKNMHVV